MQPNSVNNISEFSRANVSDLVLVLPVLSKRPDCQGKSDQFYTLAERLTSSLEIKLKRSDFKGLKFQDFEKLIEEAKSDLEIYTGQPLEPELGADLLQSLRQIVAKRSRNIPTKSAPIPPNLPDPEESSNTSNMDLRRRVINRPHGTLTAPAAEAARKAFYRAHPHLTERIPADSFRIMPVIEAPKSKTKTRSKTEPRNKIEKETQTALSTVYSDLLELSGKSEFGSIVQAILSRDNLENLSQKKRAAGLLESLQSFKPSFLKPVFDHMGSKQTNMKSWRAWQIVKIAAEESE